VKCEVFHTDHKCAGMFFTALQLTLTIMFTYCRYVSNHDSK